MNFEIIGWAKRTMPTIRRAREDRRWAWRLRAFAHPTTCRSHPFGRAVHHPGLAELVGAHAKALREEGLAERHVFAAAFGECPELALGLGRIRNRQRHRKSLRLVKMSGRS